MRRPMVSHPIGGASLRGLWAVSSPISTASGVHRSRAAPVVCLPIMLPAPVRGRFSYRMHGLLSGGAVVCLWAAALICAPSCIFSYISAAAHFPRMGGAGSARVRIASGRRFLAGGGVSRKRRAIRLAVPGQPHPVEDFLIPVNGLHPVMNRRRGLDTTRNGVGEATGDAWRDPMQPVTTWKGRCDPQRCRKRVVTGGGHGNRRRISANTGRMSTGRKNKQVRLTPRAAHITPSA